MEQERGELIAVIQRSTLKVQNNERYTLVIPFANALQGKRMIESLRDPNSELILRLTQITSPKDLPKLDIHLLQEGIESEHSRLGSVALYGLGYYTRMGKGISISLDVKDRFSKLLTNHESLEDSITISLIPRRMRKDLHDFQIGSVELIKY